MDVLLRSVGIEVVLVGQEASLEVVQGQHVVERYLVSTINNSSEISRSDVYTRTKITLTII